MNYVTQHVQQAIIVLVLIVTPIALLASAMMDFSAGMQSMVEVLVILGSSETLSTIMECFLAVKENMDLENVKCGVQLHTQNVMLGTPHLDVVSVALHNPNVLFMD